MGPSGELVDYEPQLIGFTMLDSFVTVLYSAFSEKKRMFTMQMYLSMYIPHTLCAYTNNYCRKRKDHLS